MGNKLSYCIMLMILFLYSCNVNNNEGRVLLISLDLKKEVSTNKINELLNKIDFRFMALDTTDNSYFKGSASDVYIYENRIFVLDKSQDLIFCYDDTGKFINKIFRKGQGPEEYTMLRKIAISNNMIYGLDRTKIQIYDFNGNYIRTVKLKNGGHQLFVKQNGTIVVASNYTNPYQLTVYDSNGNVILEDLPSPKQLLKLNVSQSTYNSIGECDEGVYFTNYFDNDIYLYKDSVTALVSFDFGSLNIPSDIFRGEKKEIGEKFSYYRENDKAVMKIDYLIMNEYWLTFMPGLFEFIAVYYDRKNKESYVVKHLKEPYATLLGCDRGPESPRGFDTGKGEYYRFVNSVQLKTMIEELSQQDKDYLDKYPFLKNVDLEMIDDNLNDYLLFFKIGLLK